MLKLIKTGAKTITNVAASIFAGSALLSGRSGMNVYNESANTVYYGDDTVTALTGMALLSGDSVSFLFKPGIEYPIYFVSAQNNAVRVVETS